MRFRNISLIAFLIIIVALGIVGTSFADEETPPVSEPSVSRSKENPTPLTFSLSVAGDLTVAPSDEFGPALITPLIVGGTEVSPPNAYPWVASLQYDGKHYCGGTLIHPQWILTAAHCWVDPSGIVYPITEFDSAVLGEHSLTTPSSTEQEIGFSEVHVHPDFNLDTFENDFALLKLSSPANITASVKTIELVGASVGGLVGQSSVIVGWGATAYGGPLSDTAQYANISILADSACSNYSTDYKASSMLCAGTLDGSKDACQGDSGGPLAYQVSGVWKQAGIVSWGYECGVAGYPGVYSRISSASDWINSTAKLLPGKPTLIAPKGTITVTTPLYQWAEVSVATQYLLMVAKDGTDVVTKTTYSATSICSVGTCSVDPGIALNLGNYKWWVLPKNSFGNGTWSFPASFSIQGSTPGQPTLIAPAGTVTDTTPLYQWSHVSLATDYLLLVAENGTDVVTKTTYSAASICSAGTCSVDPGITLNLGNYKWWVLPKNSSGNGTWSLAGSFSIQTSTPGQLTLIAPTGTITDTTPLYQWSHVSPAIEYLLLVAQDGTSVVTKITYSAASICSAETCSVDPGINLNLGSYKWWVLPKYSYGLGTWSLPNTFDIIS